MNRYDRYPGDWMRDTLDLSMAEDGAYNRLVDWYYANEKPIPNEARFRVSRASKTSEKRCTDRILQRYFVLTENGWVHSRCEKDIAKAKPRISAARRNGGLGGRPPKAKPSGKPSGLSSENPVGNPEAKLPPPSPEPPSSSLASVEYSEGFEPAGSRALDSGAITAQLPLDDRQADAIAAIRGLRALGVRARNVHDPRLLDALRDGVTPQQLIGLAKGLLEDHPHDDPPAFAYLLATARGQLRDARRAPAGGGKSGTPAGGAADAVLRNIERRRGTSPPAGEPDRD